MIKFASPLYKNEMKVLRGGDCDGMRHRQSLSTKTISMSRMMSASSHLMGSPKYWLAIPTVAPVMQITMDTL